MTIRVEVRQAASLIVPEEHVDYLEVAPDYWVSALYGAYAIANFQSHALVWNWKDNHWAFYRKKSNEVSDSNPPPFTLTN